MSRRIIAFTACALLAVAGTPRAASAQAAGWKTEAEGTKAVLTPPDLQDGEFYQIIVFPRESQGGAAITDFLDGFANRTVAALGKPGDKPEPSKATNHTFAVVSRLFVTNQGQGRIALFTALSLDGQNARVVGIVCSQSADLLHRYQAQAEAVIREMLKQEKAAALASGRGLNVEKLPTAPPGMTPGGALVPGIYAGNSLYGDENQGGLRLSLYASGEFRICNAEGKELEFGTGDYSYDPITGKLSVGRTFSLNNDRFDPNEEFCLYGRGADGKPYVHARSDRGFRYLTRILRYVGPTDRPSPKQEEAAKAAAEAEAKRYKWVTAPGKGIPSAQIAAVLHHQTLSPSGGSSTDEVYLLLKDGTLHDGLPVPPDEMDASLSRRREPEKWGRWRRSGAKYLAAWPDQPNHFEPLQGEVALPARRGERLAGRFGTGSTSGSMITGGGWSLWGVTFQPGERFLKDKRGGYSSGSLGQTMNGFSADTVYDDEGASTLATSPGVSVSSSSKKKSGHRGGAYSLNGYTLTLRYDDGRVTRLPFFFTSAKRDGIYFEGATLAFDDGK